MAGVVPDEEKVAYVWSGLVVLPQRQAEPAHPQKNKLHLVLSKGQPVTT